MKVSVNLSTRDLLDELLPYHVEQTLSEFGLPAERLTLEVTESSIMENVDVAISVLESLRDTGINISMDDFGTGHSSLAQLRLIPLDELKIDKAFVQNLATDTHNEAIVKTTIELAHAMNLRVVAEGVEDEHTVRRLSALNCEQGQGYFFSKPLPENQFLGWLNDYQSNRLEERRGDDRAFSETATVEQIRRSS